MIVPMCEVIGGEEVALALEQAGSDIRAATRAELQKIGDEVVARAQANAPKRTGIMAGRIVSYFGRALSAPQIRKLGRSFEETSGPRSRFADSDRGDIVFTIRPTGSVAHLIERGPQTGSRKQHPRRVQRTAAIWTRKGRKVKSFSAQTLVKEHAFRWRFRPFFMPAFESVGGLRGSFERLRRAVDAVVQKFGRAA